MQRRMILPILNLLPFTTSAVTRLAEFGHLVDGDQALLVRQATQARQITYSRFFVEVQAIPQSGGQFQHLPF